MDYDIVANSSSIKEFGILLENKSDVLNSILDKLIDTSIELEKYYNTPTGKIMRESLIEFLNKSKNVCNELKNNGVKAEKISTIYSNTFESIRKDING